MESAKRVLFAEGYDSFSIRKVAKEANIGVGTIYNYFPTKQELLHYLMAEHWNEFYDIVVKISIEPLDFYEKLRKIYSKLEQFLESFLEIWIKNMKSAASSYVDCGRKSQMVFTERLSAVIQKLLQSELQSSGTAAAYFIDYRITARFIMMNMISIAQTRHISYEDFELVLSSIIQTNRSVQYEKK